MAAAFSPAPQLTCERPVSIQPSLQGGLALKKAVRPGPVPGDGGPGHRAGSVSQPVAGRTCPVGGGPGVPVGPRGSQCGRRPFPHMATLGGTVAQISRCSVS